jgi:hypothetical protein
VPTLFFNTATGPTSILPVTTEIPIISLPVTVTAGEDVKVDYSLSIEVVATANWSINVQNRLYRDSTLIDTRIFNRSATTAGTQRFPIASTQVDTAVATGTSIYSILTFVTTANSVTAATANNIDINAIVFE